ncbi:hypothetical protein BH20ACT9_BH20ACT9_04610 [soil metagenome]
MAQRVPSTAQPSRARRIGFLVAAALVALLAGIAAYGLPALVLPLTYSGDRVIHRVHDLGHGVLMGGLITVALLSQLRHPERKIAAMQQFALAVGAFVLALLVTLSLNPFVVVFVLIVALLGFLHPARHALLRSPGKPDAAMLAIVAGGAIPLAWYAVAQAVLQLTSDAGNPHAEEFHYASMSALAVGLVLVGGLAAFRTQGWRVPAWCAGLGTIWIGLASVVFPHYEGSFGVVGGLVAVVGGVGYLVVARPWQADLPGRKQQRVV